MPRCVVHVLVLLSLFLTGAARADNAPPEVSDIVVRVDAIVQQIHVSFRLFDAENDPCEVSLRASNNGGGTFLVPVTSVSGDVGFPVTPGDTKQIIWDVSAAGLDPANEYILKIVAEDRWSIDPQTLVDAVDVDRLRTDMQTLEGRRHYSAGLLLIQATKDHIEQQFSAAGLTSSRQAFVFNSWRAENIIGKLAGQLDEAATVIVDGHFDTVSTTPGADDNASGVAGMLEAMRVLSTYNFDKSIKFIGFDLEEVGLVGSQRYVFSGIPTHERTEAVINFEMIGYTCTTSGCDDFAPIGNYIHNIGDAQSTQLRSDFDSLATAFVPDLAILSTLATPDNPNFRRSDHARFWDVGIPALFLTDGANFRNPHYHQASDLESTIDYTFLSNVVRATIASIAHWAGVQHSGIGHSAPFTPPEPTSLERLPWSDVKHHFR